MKNAKLKTYITTTLLLLGTAGMLAGCGGNKGDSNFTKEEKDEIDAAFSADERKELQNEFNDDSSSKKSSESVSYDESMTIDPLAHVSLVVTGTLPDSARIDVVSDGDKSWNWYEFCDYDFVSDFDYSIDGYTMKREGYEVLESNAPYFIKDDGSINIGDTVTVSIAWREDKKLPENYEEKIQKNIEIEKTSADIQIVADENLMKKVTSWNDLTDVEKEALIDETRSLANTYCSDVVSGDEINTMEAVSEFVYIKDDGVLDPQYDIGIGFKVADDKILYVICGAVQFKVATEEMIVDFTTYAGSFTADASVTDMNELATIRHDTYQTSGDKPTITAVEYNTLQ